MKQVLVFGTFDCIHRGHIALFEAAKNYGDHLIVVISRDITVKKNKPVAIIHTEIERKEIVSHINLVDEVRFGDLNDPYKAIEDIRPDTIVLGYDQTLFVEKLEDELKKRNISVPVVRAPAYHADRITTTHLRNSIQK